MSAWLRVVADDEDMWLSPPVSVRDEVRDVDARDRVGGTCHDADTRPVAAVDQTGRGL